MYLSETLYRSGNDDSTKDAVGMMITISFHDNKFTMEEVCWGAEEDCERSRNSEVELKWIFDEKNTKKLMLRTGTHDAKGLMKAMVERFKNDGCCVCDSIIKFCEEKGLTYSFCVYP